MKKCISKVTVTGADDSVYPHKLYELAVEFPFVEFGILLSRNAMGSTRFPSRDWLVSLVECCAGSGMDFSGHICGSWVKEILLGAWPKRDLLNIHSDFLYPDMFQRFQLNTHAQLHQVSIGGLAEVVREVETNGQSIIFQYDNVNTALIEHSHGAGCKNISALFDLSHGAGILPDAWPKPLHEIPCGYAGGLSPENVADQLAILEQVVGGTAIWIDAETRLRSSDDLNFDLGKVRAFLEAARPWVIQS